MYPSDFAACPEPVRYTLLAALCWTRQAEMVDGLAELLIGLIKQINARAERRVEKELIGALTAVPGKRTIFTKMVSPPHWTVRTRPCGRCCIWWCRAGTRRFGCWPRN
ncbi:hypothetical protein [Actinomadura coerulea]|uniref:hypothetical protein n=1 Tax=Actinomadura coerulea TaxID=46159 RepID=UPI003422AD0E